MTAEELRRIHQSQPFRPFRLRLADGRGFQIPHFEFLSFSPTGRDLAVWHEDGSCSILDVRLVAEIEIPAAA
ncbi:MAG: hypothetical protein HY360_19730 [Verrucomicrobia bacterium]|nr:hypothetical protein [Verrucomicrobiota bacterium]